MTSLQSITDPDRSRDKILAFMSGWTMEATLPSAADIESLKGVIEPGTQIYLSAIPNKPYERVIEAAVLVRGAGFEPVPHLAARNYASREEIEDYLSRLRGEADVRQLMLIAGDRDEPRGEFESSLSVLESGLLSRHRIERIGISGYPEGHPKIPDNELRRALSAKIAVAKREGLQTHIVTQFCLDPAKILAWVEGVRAAGVELPIWIGMAGPTSIGSLLKFARRCGVGASLRGIARHGVALAQLVGEATPDAIVREVAEAPHADHRMAPHFYSFAGVARTARWAAAAAAGRFELRQEGFAAQV